MFSSIAAGQVNEVDGFRRTALHYAAERDADFVDLLLGYGTDCDVTDYADGATPLHWAAYKVYFILWNYGYTFTIYIKRKFISRADSNYSK